MYINHYLKSARILSGTFDAFNPADSHPFQLLKDSLKLAFDSGVPEPSNMVLSTLDYDMPDSRIVLLKAVDESYLYFETAKTRNKVSQLDHNHHAALNFYWAHLGRQIRIQGHAELTADFSHVKENLDAATRDLNVYRFKPTHFEFYQALSEGGYTRHSFTLNNGTWHYRLL